MQNERIRSWKQDLLEELPDLELFVGRELKKNMLRILLVVQQIFLIFPKKR